MVKDLLPFPPEEITKRLSPWKRNINDDERCWASPDVYHVKEHFVASRFSYLSDANCYLDFDTKTAALITSSSVVSLKLRPAGRKVESVLKSCNMETSSQDEDEDRLFSVTGTIIECENVKSRYLGIILTSASLFRCRAGENAEDLKVRVYLSNGDSYKGDVLACDFHYNLASVRIKSNTPLETASLRCLDDAISIDPSEELSYPREKMFQLRRHSNLLKIVPGDRVIALGRYFQKPYGLMVAPGVFSMDCCDYDCKELFRANCRISMSGIGGPLINYYGEVIGINFHDYLHTPFLPINVVSKWWNHFKKHKEFCRPGLRGLQATNLYAARACFLEQFIRKFPKIFQGVMVEKVDEESPAYCAGIRPHDVIVQCGGNAVKSFLELIEILWEKAGETVELVVMRANESKSLTITMPVVEAGPVEFYSWQLPFPSESTVKKFWC